MTELSYILLSVAIFVNALLLSSYVPYLSSERKRQIIFEIAYSLVWEAERVWGGTMGDIKRAHVKAKLYITISTIPMLRHSISNECFIDSLIEEAVEKMTKYTNEDKLVIDN